jgi:hypothetical protein
MTAPASYTASEIMDMAASLLNDTAKSVYTYTAQLPYLKMAAEELKLEFQLNNLPVTNTTSQIIPVNVGDIQINPPDGAPPNYPGDLVEIQTLWERAQDSSEPWLPVTPKEFLPHIIDDIPQSMITYYCWQGNIIKLCPAGYTSAREVKIDFINDPFTILDENTPIQIINGKNFLGYRTAGLCATFVQQNEERRDACNNAAQIAMDQVTGIGTKGRQSMATRRRPFRAAYRMRGYR